MLPQRLDEWNATFCLAPEGYYHELQIGLTATDAQNRTIPEAQTVLLVKGGTWRPPAATSYPPPYFPAPDSVGHFLLGQLMGGGTRYGKARHRGQHLTSHRFAAAAVQWCLRACYARLSGDHSLEGRLSTDECKRLDALLTPEGSAAVLADLDFSTPQAMDRAVCSALARMVQECRLVADARWEQLPVPLFARMLAFFRADLRAGCDEE